MTDLDQPLNAGPAYVAHGVNCVALSIRLVGSTTAAVLTPDEADDLADLLHRQAQYAREAHTEGIHL
jgi:hypothetical protein